MNYYYNEEMESIETILKMLKVCSKYFPVPTIVEDQELKQKMNNLSILHNMWSNKLLDSLYPSEVYKQVCVMFSENVFRSLPKSSYMSNEEISNEMMWEFQQLSPVYNVFDAFLCLDGFDPEKAIIYIDKKFINLSIRRLDSCMEAERLWIKQILLKLYEKMFILRKDIYYAVINSLTDYGYQQISDFMGVKELLEIFQIYFEKNSVKETLLIKVLLPLMKRNGLVHYIMSLEFCYQSAIRRINPNLSVIFMEYILTNWSTINSTLHLPWCKVLISLYQQCGVVQWSQMRHRVVRHLTKLLKSESHTICGISIHFCVMLVNGENQLLCEDAECISEALVDIYRTHWSYSCVTDAGSLLKRLADDKDLLKGPSRLLALEALIDDRPHKMVQSMIEDNI
ncbi:uncharacterized protein LOC126904968 [Daktulosphaira vitifoliae]|uniref:uncharacterized protein LOC126904968 n=1 Tax=Daktulosphaira vitifoliae TaxID=58002 RepID=UPI0021AA319E|nr:uncharacterized protein LOC126904968 [Daktulosphaira vitifoliae]